MAQLSQLSGRGGGRAGLLLVDALPLAYRAFYGAGSAPMQTLDGRDTRASYGFARTIEQVVRDVGPACVGWHASAWRDSRPRGAVRPRGSGPLPHLPLEATWPSSSTVAAPGDHATPSSIAFRRRCCASSKTRAPPPRKRGRRPSTPPAWKPRGGLGRGWTHSSRLPLRKSASTRCSAPVLRSRQSPCSACTRPCAPRPPRPRRERGMLRPGSRRRGFSRACPSS